MNEHIGQIYHPLDGWKETDAPTTWTREIIAARIIEACKVIATDASAYPRVGNGWPEIVREWSDYIGRGVRRGRNFWRGRHNGESRQKTEIRRSLSMRTAETDDDGRANRGG
jgi:hypothetical protein